jgi:RNA 3'-terminal phosphate cyclase (ATP)
MAPKAPTPPIHLDGTTLEGGGQLLRIALSLSSLTKKSIHITNIRGNRSQGGGLKVQHLTSVQWLGQACKARLSGLGLKSKEITFAPNQNEDTSIALQFNTRGGEIQITQNTPGSITLVLQAILPYLLFSGGTSPIDVRITGGTNVSNSPSHDYIQHVLLPMLTLIGIPPISADVHTRSWSQGNLRIGSITYAITPLTAPLPTFNLTQRGDITSVRAVIIAPRETEQQFRDELDVMFEKREDRIFGPDSTSPEIKVTFEDSQHEKRYYLLLIATTSTGVKIGRDWLYDQGVRPGNFERIVPTVVKKVSNDWISEIEHGGCVDEYARDQLVVFQALADGRSRVSGGRKGKDALVEPSLHAQTAMWVAKEIVGVEFDDEGGCVGIGFRPGGKERSEDVVEEDKLVEEMERLEVSGMGS